MGKFCINYCKFNKLIIINRYLLPLAYKLQNKLYKVTIFIKFNLRITFNLIRIKINNK